MATLGSSRCRASELHALSGPLVQMKALSSGLSSGLSSDILCAVYHLSCP